MRAWPFLPSAFCCDGLVSPCSSHFGAGAATGGDGAGPCGTNQPSCAAARLNISSDDGESRSREKLFSQSWDFLSNIYYSACKEEEKSGIGGSWFPALATAHAAGCTRRPSQARCSGLAPCPWVVTDCRHRPVQVVVISGPRGSCLHRDHLQACCLVNNATVLQII